MAQSFNILPSGDVENDGWTLVASTATTVWEILSDFEDDCHVRCPSYRGGLEVRFPTDVDDLPEGAIIDSVTVKIKMETSSGTGARGVTVNVLSADNRSRYTTRTIWATGTAVESEVGTYYKDPLGRAWDIQTLNKLRLRMFSQNNIADAVRIYQLYCVVNYHTKPTVSVSSPTGTVGTPSPTVEWSYHQEEGEPQKSAVYKIFPLTQASASTFNPETADPVFSATVTGIANTYILPTSLNNNDYAVYVKVESVHGAWSSWASKQFTVSAPAPGIPGDNNAGTGGIPGVGVPTVVPDNYTSSAAIRMLDTSNLLSVNQADFEIASDPIGYVGSNATLARDTSQAFGSGVASMSITADTAADAFAVSTRVQVEPSVPITVTGQFLAGSTAQTVSIVARFLDETFTALDSSTQILASDTDADDTWTEVTATGTTPATAKYAEVVGWITDPAAGEVHYMDHVGLMYGTNTAWSDGGHNSRNLLTSFLATGDDPESSVDAWIAQNVATTTDRVDTSGTGADGLKCNQMTYVGVDPSIQPRAFGASSNSTIFNSTTSGKNYTLYKPTLLNGSAATVQSGDLLIAFVTSTESGTINPPVGWTLVNTASIDDGSTDVALHVLKRTATGTDPASWDGTLSANSSRRTAVVAAYSGADHADNQFLADAVRTSGNEPKVFQSATVVNTDPNAWRIAAFAASDDHTGMSMTANITPPSAPAGISYVGRATPWSTTSYTSTYTINRPSNVQADDIMIASVTFSGICSVTTPTGWSLIRSTIKTATSGDEHSGYMTVALFWKKATSSEPNSWSAGHTSSPRPKMSQCVAYRNVDGTDPFIDDNYNNDANDYRVGTGTVSNTNSKAWRVCMFSALCPSSDSWTGGDSEERVDSSTNLSNSPDPVVSFSDSDGSVSTGNHSRTGRLRSGSYFSAVGWIGLLRPLATGPAQGANETERVDFQAGSSDPWECTAVYDSNDVVPTGQTSVYGILDTGDDLGANSMASWIGIIKPASSVEGGTAAATLDLTRMIDVSEVDPEVFALADHKLTMMASFLGSASGTPVLAAEFYRANVLIGSQSAIGQAFNTSVWTKSWAVFDIPQGTTRIRPVLSALDRDINDTVKFDRVAVMLGGLTDPTQEPIWRDGTSRHQHTVWAKPIIQYQENDGNGYGDFSLLAGQKSLPPVYDLNTGRMTYVDHTIIPLNSRRYRVSTHAYGLEGDVFSSGYGPVSSEAIFEPRTWWLKDIQDLSKNIQVTVRWKDMQVDTANMATTFQPIGAQFPVVITEGFKGDTFSLDIHCEQAEFTALMKLLNSGRTLILQSDIDKMWWVRPVGNIQANILATSSRQERPRRYVSVTFVEVAPEE